MQQAVLRLFHAVQVTQPHTGPSAPMLLARTIQQGYLLDPAIPPVEPLLATIEEVIGLTGEQANAAFHKSWRVVQEYDLETLVLQQIVHYITTYGFEQVGLYRQDLVYIPAELLELPAIQADLPLVVIRALDPQSILQRIVTLGAGVALAPTTLADMMTIVKANHYDPAFVAMIGNRELRTLLDEFYGLTPTEPVAFLRYLIYSLTGETLLIKNAALIKKIKGADRQLLDRLLLQAPADLATIFLRYKPLFLALKKITGNKTFFNRLRKQAVTQHKPLPEDYLNSVTAQIKRARLDLFQLAQRLTKAPIFRKIRLAYALKQRLQQGDTIVYRVRNGRGWATDFTWPAELQPLTQQALTLVLTAIAADLRPTVHGKTIYIPAHVHYALPATEKQFTGYLPTGSSVAVPQDLVVGIHWTNTHKRVDLDLSVIGETGKIGWDVAYRTEDRTVLFSGDVTDAPPNGGGAELFYFKAEIPEARILLVNFFNFESGDAISCRLVAAHETPLSFDRNYMINVNHLVASAPLTLTNKQTVLGLIIHHAGANRVYFAQVSIGNAISARHNKQTTHVRKFLLRTLVDPLDLRELLQMAGATLVDTPPTGAYIDLSPTQLDKTTIIDLINPALSTSTT